MDEEIWKSIKGYEGLYEVSSFGRIKSLSKIRRGGRYNAPMVYRERILKPNKNGQGYFKVSLCKNGSVKTGVVHKLVAVAFHGASCLEVNHIDGIKTNNDADNLEYVTSSENHFHAYKNGLMDRKGERHHLHKLNGDAIKNIRENKFNLTAKEFAACFGVCTATVYNVLRGKTWGCIPA